MCLIQNGREGCDGVEYVQGGVGLCRHGMAECGQLSWCEILSREELLEIRQCESVVVRKVAHC